jgi:hypothetical protein
MKKAARLFVSSIALLLLFNSAFSQHREHRHEDADAKVTIKVDGKEQDIEVYFEEWGRQFGEAVENMFDDSEVRIDLDEGDLEIDIDHLSISMEHLAESIESAVRDAVTNMTIEINDLEPDEFDQDFSWKNDNNLEDWIDEIEDKYDSKVKQIRKLKIKIREDYVKMEMNAILESGKRIQKIKIIPH